MALNPLFLSCWHWKKIKVNTEGCRFVLGITLSLEWVVYVYLHEYCSDPEDSSTGWTNYTDNNYTVKATLKSQWKEDGYKMPNLLL